MSIIHLLSLKLYKILMVAEEPLTSSPPGSIWIFVLHQIPTACIWKLLLHLLHNTPYPAMPLTEVLIWVIQMHINISRSKKEG